jgi:hypothetical protein
VKATEKRGDSSNFGEIAPTTRHFRHYRLKPLCRARHNGFTANTFQLFSETAQDGDRVARERDETEEVRRMAEAAQAPLFTMTMPDED